MVLHYDRDHEGRLFRARQEAALCHRFLAANRGWCFRPQGAAGDAWPTQLAYRGLETATSADRRWVAPAGIHVYAWERPGETCTQLALWTACAATEPEEARGAAAAARARAVTDLLALPTALNSKSRLLWEWAPGLSPAVALQGRYVHLRPGPGARRRRGNAGPAVRPGTPAALAPPPTL
jgi:hypothetical protein